MATDPAITVIIPNFNGLKWLRECFDSLRRQTFQDFETVMVDNASGDGSVEFTEEEYPQVKVIRAGRNLGYVGAIHLALPQARGDYLFFLNNDTRIDDDCLKELHAAMANHPEAGICACKLISYDGEKYLSNGMGIDILGYNVLSRKVFFADGAATFIRKTVFEAIGGFDLAHYMFSEDIDLSWRAQLLGFSILPVEKAVVYHYCGGTAGGAEKKAGVHATSTWRRYLTERNTLRNILKNYGIFTLLWACPLYLILISMEMLLFVFLGKPHFLWQIHIKALLYNIKVLPETLRLRKTIQAKRTLSDWNLLKRISFKLSKFEQLKYLGIPRFEENRK